MAHMAAVLNDGGKRVCMERIKLGMSMRGLAERSGLSVAAISRIERGIVSDIRPLSAQKICSALGMTFDELFSIQAPGATGGAGEAQTSGEGEGVNSDG